MPNIDLKFYLAVFLRRLPYFLVIAALVAAVGITLAAILPPNYRSAASILVEPQQIPGDLATATVGVDPYEQAQIIEQRIMT
ncbi:lipopolysaccharide biosynthesis protein, partial [Amaricoccus sp. HAR-UPW-R2A-40]